MECHKCFERCSCVYYQTSYDIPVNIELYRYWSEMIWSLHTCKFLRIEYMYIIHAFFAHRHKHIHSLKIVVDSFCLWYQLAEVLKPWQLNIGLGIWSGDRFTLKTKLKIHQKCLTESVKPTGLYVPIAVWWLGLFKKDGHSIVHKSKWSGFAEHRPRADEEKTFWSGSHLVDWYRMTNYTVT